MSSLTKPESIREKHYHEHSAVKLIRITNVHKDYKGTSGDKAFLAHVCNCDDLIAFDYGSFKAMKAKLKELPMK